MSKLSLKERKKLKIRLKRLAPKVPDFTCPDIDFVLQKIEESKLNERTKKICKKKMERLRTQNEQLRDSGQYWYEKMCSYVFEE